MVLVAVALSITVASAGVVATDTTVTRDNDDLVITPGEHNSNTTKVQVVAESPRLFGVLDEGLVYNANKESSADSFRINTTTPTTGDISGKSLEVISVDINYGQNQTSANTSLYSLTATEEIPVFASGGALYVRTNPTRTQGLVNNSRITVEFQNSGSEAIGVYEKDHNRVRIPLSDLPSVDNLSGDTIRIRSYDGGVITSIEVSSELRSTGEELILWNPLITPETEFTVTANGNSDTLETEHAGVLPLPDVEDSSEVDIRVTQDNETLLSDTLTIKEPPEISGEFGEETLRLPSSLSTLSIQSALISDEDGISTISSEQTAIGSIAYSASSPPQEAILSTPSGLMTVYPYSGGQGLTPSGIAALTLPILLLLIVGLSVGAGGGHLLGTDDSAFIGAPLISFVMCIFAAVAILTTQEANLVASSPLNISTYVGLLLGTIAAPAGVYMLDEIKSDSNKRQSTSSSSHSSMRSENTSEGTEWFEPEIRVIGEYDHIIGKEGSNDVFSKIDPNATIAGGQLTIKAVNAKGEKSSPETVSYDDPHAKLKLPTYKKITARCAGSPFEIDDVEISTIEKSQGGGKKEIRIPSTKDSIEVELSHAKFHSKTITVGRGEGTNGKVEVELEPKTGEVEINTEVDNIPSPNTEVLLEPQADTAKYVSDETVSTDDSGSVTVDKLIGNYTVTHKNTSTQQYYSVQTQSIQVRYKDWTKVNLNFEFGYALSQSHRDTILRLREDIDSLSDSTYDTAIQTYFGSVIEEGLQAVESIPNHGELFFETDHSPDEAARALLNASSECLGILQGAMSTKRNIDLFTACGDMQDRNISWSHPNLLESFLNYKTELSGEASREMKKDVKQQYDSVDDLISDERKEVSEISPIEVMHDRIIDLLGTGETNTEKIAAAHMTQQMLDAIEEFFGHEALCDRLNRTVF